VTRIAAVILAGGRATRMGGVNKGLLDIGGKRLIDWALEAVRGCDPLLLSVGDTSFAIPGTVEVRDLPTDYAGPLAGVAAAVDRLAADPPDLLLSLAVDAPFFPKDFVERAEQLLATSSAVLATYGGQDYPTNALWRFDAVQDLPAQVLSGTAQHSLKRLANDLAAARLDYAGLLRDDPFINANTPEDLAILRARASANRFG
jgi:molybdopterin-guanine dinucleotide biosynthesis protein A